jgi:hypothetical protein
MIVKMHKSSVLAADARRLEHMKSLVHVKGRIFSDSKVHTLAGYLQRKKEMNSALL